MGRIELTYGKTLKRIMLMTIPIKKLLIKTHGITHKFINENCMKILNNETYYDVSIFMKNYIGYINEGAVWADTDYKSSNHFYNIDTLKGLYGFSNLLKEFKKYYDTVLYYIEKRSIEKTMFYVGVCMHLIQDSTVPQHGSVDLFNEHRKFEMWIKSKVQRDEEFKVEKGIQRFERLDDYIVENIRYSQAVNRENINVLDKEERYRNIATKILRQAHETSTGFLIDIYERLMLADMVF